MYLIRYLAPLPLIAFLLLSHIAMYFSLRLLFFNLVDSEVIERHLIPHALYIGLKFDARYAVFTTLPVLISLLIPYLERKLSNSPSFYRKIICLFQTCVFATFSFVYVADFIVFLYSRQRIDTTVIEYVENPIISAIMVWESYPIVKISLGLLAFLIVYYLFYNWIIKQNVHVPIRPRTPWKSCCIFHGNCREEIKRDYINFLIPFSFAIALRVLAFLIIATLIMGQISSSLFPLRWSNAYISTDYNISSLALHPVQNLYDTRHVFEVVNPTPPENFNGYVRMAKFLESDTLQSNMLVFSNNKPDFSRYYSAKKNTKPLNFIIIMMESLATNRTSLNHGMASINAENPKKYLLDPTPFLKELVNNSLYYPNFFCNSRTTARAIFSSLTGIPDVNFNGGTSSRNPKSIDQHLIFNQFNGYEKYYLIGGNANWANIRGLLQNNINDLKLLEDNYWKAPNVDVWGVSDLALLRESIEVFNATEKPFLAYIQTAGFHRPYTIPSDNEGFVLAENPKEEAIKYWGFENTQEYQSIRFADHSLKRFFERARKTNWFNDTIFLIYGDHGLTNYSKNMNQNYLNLSLQSWHVPFILYAPGKILNGVNPALHSQVDIFPTLAYLAGIGHVNTSFGKNMLKRNPNGLFIPKEFALNTTSNIYSYCEKLDKEMHNKVFIAVREGITYSIKNNFVYKLDLNNKNQNLLYNIDTGSNNTENLIETNPHLALKFEQDVSDFYYSAKYLIQNNKKNNLKIKEN